MRLAFALHQFDQILRRQPRGFGEHGTRDGNLVMPGEAANDRRRRLLDGGELAAHFGQRNARRDIGQRSDLDGLDQALQHVAEQLDLLAAAAVDRRQKQVGDAPEGFEVLFRRTGLDGRLDLVGDRSV
jgi:hypothetical protein